ncbi:MAG TPA: hypothetical protein VFT91_09990 [Dehalococcoidia bacterium]|nr:hypothetical protein [Dehalococcoidia bacterium]
MPALLAGLTLALAACGGSGGGSNSGSIEDLLKQMALRAEDLPAGYTPGEGQFASNEDVALGDQEKLAKLQQQGRLKGYDIAYDRGDVSETVAPFVGVESAVNLYETDDGASRGYADKVDEARKTDWEQALGFGETQTQEVPRKFGDETLWLRVTGVVSVGPSQTSVLVIDDYILLRQGRAYGYLRLFSAKEGSSDRSSLMDEVAALAQKQLRRIKDGLR